MWHKISRDSPEHLPHSSEIQGGNFPDFAQSAHTAEVVGIDYEGEFVISGVASNAAAALSLNEQYLTLLKLREENRTCAPPTKLSRTCSRGFWEGGIDIPEVAKKKTAKSWPSRFSNLWGLNWEASPDSRSP